MAIYRFRFRPSTFAKLLARKNFSQNDLARELGVSSGFLSQLVNGSRHAGPKTRRRIMAAIPRARFEELFEEVTEPHEEVTR
jgi:transcriptional regulator with XRE-family HTH domain